MSRELLALGSIAIVIATAILLILNQDESKSPLITPISSNSTTLNEKSLKQNDTTLGPPLPSLSKPFASSTDLSLKEPLPEAKPYPQTIATPKDNYRTPRQLASPSSDKILTEKLISTVKENTINPVKSREDLSPKITESSPQTIPRVFTHRSRPIVPPIDYPVVITEPLTTPTPVLTTPTTLPETLTTPTPTPTPVLATPTTPTETLTTPTPTPTPVLATPTTPTETLTTPTSTPTPVLATPHTLKERLKNPISTPPTQAAPVTAPTPTASPNEF